MQKTMLASNILVGLANPVGLAWAGVRLQLRRQTPALTTLDSWGAGAALATELLLAFSKILELIKASQVSPWVAEGVLLQSLFGTVIRKCHFAKSEWLSHLLPRWSDVQTSE